MNEIFAIDPESPIDWRDLKTLCETFGFNTGRFVAAFPDNWDAKLTVGKDVGDLDRKRIEVLRGRLKRALLGVRRPYMDDRSWEDNANREKAHFEDVLGKKNNGKGFMCLAEFLWGENGRPWTSSIGDHIPKTVESYLYLLRPLIIKTKELHIFDGYLLDNLVGKKGDANFDRFRQLLEGFASQCDGYGKSLAVLLHLRTPDGRDFKRDRDILEAKLSEIRANLSNQRVTVKIKEARDLFEPHGRYVLSVFGGVKIDHGIVFSTRGRNDVHWLSEVELAAVQKHIGI